MKAVIEVAIAMEVHRCRDKQRARVEVPLDKCGHFGRPHIGKCTWKDPF